MKRYREVPSRANVKQQASRSFQTWDSATHIHKFPRTLGLKQMSHVSASNQIMSDIRFQTKVARKVLQCVRIRWVSQTCKNGVASGETRAALYGYMLAGLACSRKHNRTLPSLCIHAEDKSARVTQTDASELPKTYEVSSLETHHQQKVCEYPLFTLIPQCVQVVYLNSQQHRSEGGATPLLGMAYATCIARTAQRRVGYLGIFK